MTEDMNLIDRLELAGRALGDDRGALMLQAARELRYARRDDNNEHNWSTATIIPSFWWKLKLLFSRKKELTFCWGAERFFLDGFSGQNMISHGGIPSRLRHRIRKQI